MSYLFDTNILIYLLNDQLPQFARDFIIDAIQDQATISVITRIEILGWSGHSDPVPKAVTDLLQQVLEQELTEPIIQESIQLRRQNTLKLPDAIIAATARHLQVPLVTRNIEDFQNITNLTLINPFELPTEPDNN
jgi:predicted nucleic acid-binding protein